MNKGIFVITLIFLSFSSIAQNFDLQAIGYKPVVYEVDSVPATELFKRVKNWADLTYENPTIVLIDDTEMKSISINGYAKRVLKYQMHKYDFEYKIYIEFKDGRYRLNFKVGDLYTPDGDKSYANYTSFFKKDASIKNAGVKAKSSLDDFFNALADDIYKWTTDTFDDHLQEEDYYDEEW